MVLLGNHVEALDSAIRSNRSQGLSLERIESLIEDVSSLDATSPEDYAKQKLDEEHIFSNHEARRDSSLRLAQKYSKDAILWILVNYDTAKKPAAQYYKGPLSPVVFWQVELYGRDGRELFADQYRQVGADTVGDFNEGERDVFTVIYPSTYARANETLAIGLSRDGLGSLSQSILKARAAK
jgi:hypothetical protein